MGVSTLNSVLLHAACAGLAVAAGTEAGTSAKQSNLLASTTNGPVQGIQRGSTATWWGIPFAEPPVGDLRLRSPVELRRTWTEPLQAHSPPPICKQLGLTPGTLLGQEDCLYLNVHSPAGRGDELLPVMVWIFGGGYIIGDGHEAGLYDGHNLSERHDVVVVTLNYRLNMLGFFALDSLKEEDPAGSTGNYALQDQQLAMRWVQNNIRSFGGDPARVTVFGESAGAFSVMWHLVSPTSKGLFSAAIMESGTSSVNWFFQPYQLATAFWEEVATNLGCAASLGAAQQRSCLRSIETEHFVTSIAEAIWYAVQREIGIRPKNMPKVRSTLWPLMPFGPVIDGSPNGLLDVPINLVKRGEFNHVPLLLGANENGGTIFEPMMPLLTPHIVWPASWAPNDGTTKQVMQLFFGEHADRVHQEYSDEEFSSASFPADARISRVVRDLAFMCSNRALARAWSDAGLPTFLYVFRFNYGILERVLKLGDFHAGELPFVFRNFLKEVELLSPGKHADEMADIISCNWASFAYSQDPNGGNQQSWPPNCTQVHATYTKWPHFSREQASYYSLEVTPQVLPIRPDNVYPDDLFPRDTKCDLWDELAPVLPWTNDAAVAEVAGGMFAHEAQLVV